MYLKKLEILDKLNHNVKKYGKVMLKDKNGYVRRVVGALGDQPKCAAFVEDTKRDPMWQTKYYGIKYWFKGITDNKIIDTVTLTKKAFIGPLRYFPFIILFKRRFINYIWEIYQIEGGLKSKLLKDNEFCPVCQEIVRVGKKVFRRDKVIDLVYCVAMFLQFSTSYRVRVQEFFEVLDLKRFNKAPLRELMRIRRIMISRDEEKKKTAIFLNLLILAFIFKGKLIKEAMSEIDTEKMKFDDADWYYVLRRFTYDYRGIPREERLKEAQRIDKEHDNIILGI
ncbi:MAG: hypothetical protein U9O94_05240 [Nanoarchaeota archaeon]|nr:hypothetical protein [Nanoarchaeota archaeon]